MRGFENKGNPVFVHVSKVPGLADGAHEVDGGLAHIDASGLTCDIDGTRWFIPLFNVHAVRQVQKTEQISEAVIERGGPNRDKSKDED